MKILRALMLMLALSVCAYAGNMPNLSPDTPPPTQTPGEMPNLSPGTTSTMQVAREMDNGVSADAQATETTITGVALGLLQSALSVL